MFGVNNPQTKKIITTYDRFVEAVDNGTLVPFTWYVFEYTPSWTNNLDGGVSINYDETIAILALTNNTYDPKAYSVTYEGDRVRFNHIAQTTLLNQSYDGQLNMGVLNDIAGGIVSIVGDTITFIGSINLTDYIYFVCFDNDDFIETWLLDDTVQNLVDTGQAVFTDIGGGMWTMQILSLSIPDGNPFIPLDKNYAFQLYQTQIDYQSSGIIYKRESTNDLKTSRDFRGVWNYLFYTQIKDDGLVIAEGYFSISKFGSFSFTAGNRSPGGFNGAVRTIEVEVDPLDFIFVPMVGDIVSSRDADIDTGSDPFTNPGNGIFNFGSYQCAKITQYFYNTYFGANTYMCCEFHNGFNNIILSNFEQSNVQGDMQNNVFLGDTYGFDVLPGRACQTNLFKSFIYGYRGENAIHNAYCDSIQYVVNRSIISFCTVFDVLLVIFDVPLIEDKDIGGINGSRVRFENTLDGSLGDQHFDGVLFVYDPLILDL